MEPAVLSPAGPPDASLDLGDRRWAERIRAGDADAFETVFRELYPGLCSFVTHRVRSRAIAEDIVQDLFLSLWKKRAALDLRQSLPTYLYSAARNRALNHLRHERVVTRWRRLPRGERDDPLSPLERDLWQAELSTALQRAITRLPERCRAVFTMSRQQGKSYAEIAAAMHISVKTVDAQMGRALKFIRAQLRDWLT
jgi:RNA polymerase sigma-70 factor (ECF subfamily)